MTGFSLSGSADLATIAIRVKDRDKMIAFYRDLIGFVLKGEENALAIMGTTAEKCEQLWLEESPRAEDHFGKSKKLQVFSLRIPNISELADIYARLQKQGYPIAKLVISEDLVRIQLVDPEENQLALFATHDKEVAVESELAQKASGKSKSLSANVHVTQVHLNVNDVAAEANFLQDVLGLNSLELQQFNFGEDSLLVELGASDSEAIAIDSHEIIGLEFLKFLIDAEAMRALEQHLTALNQAFYIDKKKTVLTIYDAIGLEWWFVKRK